MMKLTILLQNKLSVVLLSFLFSTSIFAQNPTGYIANWKNDAKGAYSIVHDDYGDTGVDGIWQYADTICANRGVKFTIGAITTTCENTRNINGYSTPYEYAKEVMIAQHGHEIMSHSHTHACALGNAGWSPCNMTVGWGEDSTNSGFDFQLVKAHNSILAGTGIHAKYYIFPYDRFTDLANAKLKSMGYLGTRTGWTSYDPDDSAYHRNGYENNDEVDFFPDSGGFFRTAVQVFDDNNSAMNFSDQVTELNREVDSAITNNQWANRELHNVTNGGFGWGRVRIDSYRAHINYLQQKVSSGDLFVGTVSEIMTYQMQKLKFEPKIAYDLSKDIVEVNWDLINPQYDVDMTDYLQDAYFKSPITLVVKLDLSGIWMVSQNSNQITDVKQIGDTMYINVYPHLGDLEIYNSNSNVNFAPVVENSIPDKNKNMDFNSFNIYLKKVYKDETVDDDLIFTYSGNDGVDIYLYNGVAVISSINGWTGMDTITFTAEDAEGLITSEDFIITVTDIFAGQTPYSGTPIAIPGRVEVEDYDDGVEGIAYHEVSSPWEPSPADNPYRVNSDPDVQEIPSGGYAIGYGVTNEWLEYTVDVQQDGWYNVVFRVAQLPDGWGAPVGEMTLYMDNNVWVPKTEMAFTSGWHDYTDVNQISTLKLKAGIHVLKMEITTAGSNIDYIDVVESPLSVYDETRNNSFGVFPNPVQDVVNFEGDYEMAYIINQVGELVYTTQNSEMDVRDLAEGVYYVKFDEYPEMIKFIKSK